MCVNKFLHGHLYPSHAVSKLQYLPDAVNSEDQDQRISASIPFHQRLRRSHRLSPSFDVSVHHQSRKFASLARLAFADSPKKKKQNEKEEERLPASQRPGTKKAPMLAKRTNPKPFIFCGLKIEAHTTNKKFFVRRNLERCAPMPKRASEGEEVANNAHLYYCSIFM